MTTADHDKPSDVASQAAALDSAARHEKVPRLGKIKVTRYQKIVSGPELQAWSPPDFGDQRRARIGASVVEQFVAGHNASDVLRELVQNEFDGGGNRLAVTFGEHSLDVIGNGRGITADGWKRLSVIVGTGRVVGDGTSERVAAKTNGIGSKNFGLRSLFLFGDQIYVRSGGHVAILDLPTLETGKVRDPGWWGGTGVRLRVPYRSRAFEKLEPFTAEEEKRVLETIAGGMLATLVKLALVGRKPGLRGLLLRSARNGRTLSWRQNAETIACRVGGVSLVRRMGRLVDQLDDGTGDARTFEELEFTRAVAVPAAHISVSYPDYYRKAGGMIKICVSLPILRRRIDHTRTGHFYYPLQTPDSRTGCAVSVSAPFDLDSDRGSLVDNSWNRWLIDQAAVFTIALLKEDWFRRFGVDAFKALVPNGPATPLQFAEALAKCLSTEACWPTKAVSSEERFTKASGLALPDTPVLEGLLSDSQYPDPALLSDEDVKTLVLKSGAKRFTAASLVRLRCAGAVGKHLETKLGADEADYHFTTYEASLSKSDLQVKMAATLTALARHLSKANRADLRASPSTLTATGQLRPATTLVRVESGIWDVCPEPLGNRLHPDLVGHRAISGLCQEFNEQDWVLSAASRAREGRIDDAEREAIYAKLLADGAQMGRRILAALRESPVVRNQRGEWTAPSKMVMLKGAQAKLMAPVVDAPSTELIARTELLTRLRIRDHLNRDDILAFATSIGGRSETAQRFESLLNDNQRLLSPALVKELKQISFLRARSGALARPFELHLDTLINRLCVQDENRIIDGPNDALYRRLRIHDHPTLETLLGVLRSSRERSEAPSRADVIYPALVSTLGRDRNALAGLADEPILWLGTSYHAPNKILVGPHIPRLFDGIVPVLRRTDTLSRAYLDLGAGGQPRNEHWALFFGHVSNALNNDVPVSTHDRRVIMEAYLHRSSAGLPEGLDEDACCLLDREGHLW